LNVSIDTQKKKIVHNGKEITLDLFFALDVAPVGTSLEIVSNESGIVTVKVHIPE
jgi:hypothetical protein